MTAQIIEQFELFSEAELETLEFLPEELENIEAELIPDLESISPEKVAKDLEAYFEGDIGGAGLEAHPPIKQIVRRFDQCWFSGQPHTRSFGNTNYGPVKIVLQQLVRPPNRNRRFGPRPIKVGGFIMPVHVGNRRPTPAPSAGIGTGEGVDPGHLMALELGGPDVSQNIAPQWGRWQRHGRWREMERMLKVRATKEANDSRDPAGGPAIRSVYYTVELEYRDTGTVTPSLRAWAFPKAFYVTAYVMNLDRTNQQPPFMTRVKFKGEPNMI